MAKLVRNGEVASKPLIRSAGNNDMPISELKRVTGILQRQDDHIDPEVFFHSVRKIPRKVIPQDLTRSIRRYGLLEYAHAD